MLTQSAWRGSELRPIPSSPTAGALRSAKERARGTAFLSYITAAASSTFRSVLRVQGFHENYIFHSNNVVG